MGRVVSITAGGGKAFRVEAIGLQSLKVTLRELLVGVANERDLTTGEKTAVTMAAKKMLQAELGDAATIVRDRMRSNARSMRWPGPVVAAIFRYSELSASERRGVRGALAGVRTGAPRIGRAKDPDLYVEWRARAARQNLSRRWKVRAVAHKAATGRLIGMSLARIMESGTVPTRNSSKLPRPAIAPAIQATRQQVLQRCAAGYYKVVQWVWERHGGKRAA